MLDLDTKRAAELQVAGATEWLERNASRLVGMVVNGDSMVACMVVDSGATNWGLDTFEPFRVVTLGTRHCGFTVVMNVSGDRSDRSMFERARLTLCGNVVRYARGWELDNVEVTRISRECDWPEYRQ